MVSPREITHANSRKGDYETWHHQQRLRAGGMDTATGLKHIARIGFDCVDIFTEAMTISDAEKHIIAATCDREGLPIMSLPVVATGLIDFNEPVRDFPRDPLQGVSSTLQRSSAQGMCCWCWASTCGSAK